MLHRKDTADSCYVLEDDIFEDQRVRRYDYPLEKQRMLDDVLELNR